MTHNVWSGAFPFSGGEMLCILGNEVSTDENSFLSASFIFLFSQLSIAQVDCIGSQTIRTVWCPRD